MGYIDKAFYRDVYKGVVIVSDDELDVLIERASNLIDELTLHKIPFAGGVEVYFQPYPEAPKQMMQTAVKNAVACEVEYLFCSGGAYAANDGVQSGGNVRIGNFSYTDAGKTASVQNSAYGSDARYSRSVYGYLSKTDLLFRGVGLCT